MNKKILFAFLSCIAIFTAQISASSIDVIEKSLLKRDFTLAIKEGERLLSASPSQMPGFDEYYFLALAYLNKGITRKALDISVILFEEYKLSNLEKSSVALIKAYAYKMRGQSKESLRWLQRACEFAPENASIYRANFQKKRTVKSNKWYQVGAFSKKENATALFKKLKQKGFPSKIVKSGGLYKVRVKCPDGACKSKVQGMGLPLKAVK